MWNTSDCEKGLFAILWQCVIPRDSSILKEFIKRFFLLIARTFQSQGKKAKSPKQWSRGRSKTNIRTMPLDTIIAWPTTSPFFSLKIHRSTNFISSSKLSIGAFRGSKFVKGSVGIVSQSVGLFRPQPPTNHQANQLPDRTFLMLIASISVNRRI